MNIVEETRKIVLNKEQKEAVEHKGGPLLIIAGAGTGKTTVITERIKWLMMEKGVSPANILALTFTEKAAFEMIERVDKALPLGYFDLWISTFHGFGERILRDEALEIGLNPGFRLLTPAEALAFVKDRFWEFEIDYFRPSGNPYKFIEAMLVHFSRLKDEDISPTQYLHWTQVQRAKGKVQNENSKFKIEEIKKSRELAKAYQKYEELKMKEGLMDFSDLIGNTLRLFREKESVMKKYREKFPYILVDEFQDTNYAQNELVLHLAGRGGNITVVADDDQSIYRWRGAAISNVIQFRRHFPKAEIVTLTKNYRSTQEILDRAYDLIQKNNPDRLEIKEGVRKKLESQVLKNGPRIELMVRERAEDEAHAVAKEIYELKQNQDYAWKDFAILVRANNHAESFVRALSRWNIPFQFLGPGQLLRQKEILELMAYLKVLADYEDDASLYQVLNSEFIGLKGRDLAALMRFKRKFNFSLFEVLEILGGVQTERKPGGFEREWRVMNETRDKLRKFVEMVNRHLRLVPKETAGQIIYYFLKDSFYLEKMVNHQSEKEEKRALNISKFFDKLREYEATHEKADIYAVVDWLELMLTFGESPAVAETDWTRENKVNILTLHSAKGLEFPVVILVNLVVDRFPTREKREKIEVPNELIKEVLPEGDYHLQEERRLFYVGMTRARERLYFSAAKFYGEGKRRRNLSPFIEEAGLEEVKSEKLKVKSEESQLALFDWGLGEKVESEENVVPQDKKIRHRVDFISYSQMETFRICPLHYKLKYLLRIPTLPSAAQSFGNSIHAALKDFYQKIMKGERVGVEELLGFLESRWESLGYKSKKHEQESLKKARSYLIDYWKRGHREGVQPLLLEEFVSFRIRESLKVGGRIDRVDKTKAGIEVIDYKTGMNVYSQKEIDRDLQLSIYAMAATKTRQSPFGVSPKEVRLSFYFFEEQKWLSTSRTTEQLEEAEEKILDWVKEVENSSFSCSGHLICQDCEYKQFCQLMADEEIEGQANGDL